MGGLILTQKQQGRSRDSPLLGQLRLVEQSRHIPACSLMTNLLMPFNIALAFEEIVGESLARHLNCFLREVVKGCASH